MRSLPGLDLELDGADRSAPAETPESLKAEFAARRRAQLAHLDEQERRRRRVAAVAGALAGLAAVLVTCGVTRKEITWHSFLLEALLCGAAGYWLARLKGGLLKGVLLFAGAYLLATLLRAMGLDPSVVFDAGDLRRLGSVTGSLASLAALAAIGGAFGHLIADG